jgi:hypothetical protein
MLSSLPHLPKRIQKVVESLKDWKISPRLVFFITGFLATAWFLIRVIPKPSRAAYPCMQATAPFMSAFVVYLLSLVGSVLAFNRFRFLLKRSSFPPAFLFLAIAVFLFLFSGTQRPVVSLAGNARQGLNYFPPNEPIGIAQGIFPGRVVWMWDPDATNENCSNTSNNNGVIDPGDDGWFMEANNDLAVIDSMVIKSLLALTGATENAEAWELIFRFFNNNHGFGDIGYAPGEKILIKINATSAYGGLAWGKYNADLGRNDDQAVNAFCTETDPYVVLSLLRQLVNVAQVPEDMIYVGDPARNIYKEFFDLWYGEFPGVNYLGNNLLYPELEILALGRTPVVVTPDDKVFWSDAGTVMPDAVTDKLFTIFEDIDYLINVPALKAHSAAGITLAAKNHFGSFTRQWAMHLHKGLMDNFDNPVRLGYGLYRVQTDIMMHNLLSGKNLLIIVDGLYPSEEAGAVPFKWISIPFSNDWCSSLFMSLDPVAIESVCHDFLRTEYNGPTIPESRPNWYGVDDYLHQAADSSLWPEEITYDPDNDGILINSLGVHEHWNDSLQKQYTRNLGTGTGIELFKAHDSGFVSVDEHIAPVLLAYPNPVGDLLLISGFREQSFEYAVMDYSGKLILSGIIEAQSNSGIKTSGLTPGIYLLTLRNSRYNYTLKFIRSSSSISLP